MQNRIVILDKPIRELRETIHRRLRNEGFISFADAFKLTGIGYRMLGRMAADGELDVRQGVHSKWVRASSLAERIRQDSPSRAAEFERRLAERRGDGAPKDLPLGDSPAARLLEALAGRKGSPLAPRAHRGRTRAESLRQALELIEQALPQGASREAFREALQGEGSGLVATSAPSRGLLDRLRAEGKV